MWVEVGTAGPVWSDSPGLWQRDDLGHLTLMLPRRDERADQNVRIDIRAIGPDDGSKLVINTDLSELARIHTDRLKDRTT